MIEFPYLFRKDNFYPIIPIELRKGAINFQADALVDSGASMSVFQAEVAECLRINHKSGQKRLFQGIGGKIAGYAHNIKANVGGTKFMCKIAFSDELETSLNILGRDNFFEHFLVCFDETAKKSILKSK